MNVKDVIISMLIITPFTKHVTLDTKLGHAFAQCCHPAGVHALNCCQNNSNLNFCAAMLSKLEQGFIFTISEKIRAQSFKISKKMDFILACLSKINCENHEK